jgi:hypothetical protein
MIEGLLISLRAPTASNRMIEQVNAATEEADEGRWPS